MRRFRFIGNPKEYRWENPPVYFKAYDFNQFKKDFGFGADLEIFNELQNSEDFREVFDDPKPLHKDTDLGYFAGLAMQALVSNNFSPTGYQNGSREDLMEEATRIAKELIKQLDQEFK